MSFTKITTTDLADKGVVGLPDTPNLSVTALQKKFDEIATDVIVPKFNNLCDEMDAYADLVDVSERVKSSEITNIRTDADANLQISKDGGTTWSNTASSGHIIEDGNDVAYPSRGRMQFSSNVSISDDPTDNTTFIQIPSGEKGDKGDGATITVGTVTQGTTTSVTNVGSDTNAIFDFVLQKGDSGSAATVQVGTVTQGTNASVSNRGTSSNAIFDFVLPKGDKGDTGTSFQVKGMYATYADLVAAHPTGSKGDAYAVGDSTSNVIYNWDIDQSTWVNLGGLKGVKGDAGDAATLTVGTVTTLDPDDQATVVNDGTTSAAVFSFGIPKGAKGDIGTAATIAVGTVTKGDNASVTNSGTASNAIFDFTLPKGDKGDPSTVNGKTGTAITINGADILLTGYTNGQTGDVTASDTVNTAISKLSNASGGARIIVTTDNESVGNTFTCTKGTTSYSVTSTSTEVIFTVSDVGTWTIKNVEANNSTTVSVPYYGVYRVTLGSGNYIIKTYYSSTYVGATFTITDGTNTKTFVGDSTQITSASFASAGTYTISNSVDSTTKTVTITEEGTAIANVGYAALLTVTYDTEFSGNVIKVTDGTTSLLQTASEESLIYALPNTGTWTISSTISGQSYTNKVVVTTDTMYTAKLAYSAQGYAAWVTAGGLDASLYSSLDDVLADALAVRTLMIKHDSVDYLLSWMSSDDTIIDTFVASETAMKYIGLKDYAWDTLSTNATFKSAALASDNWELILNASETATTNTITLTTPMCVTKWESATEGTLSGSNDNSTWTEVDANNTDYYIYYKLSVSTTSLTIYGRALAGLIPTMRSNTTPKGSVTGLYMAGGTSSTPAPSDTSLLYYAFDGNSSTHVGYSTENVTGGYVEYDFPTNVTINEFVLVVGSYASSNNLTATPQYYNDALEKWENLSNPITVTGTTLGSYTTYVGTFDEVNTSKVRIISGGTKTSGINVYVNKFQVYDMDYKDYSEDTSISVYSAASDTVYYYANNDTTTTAITLCTTDTDGLAESVDISGISSSTYLYSTVAKDTTSGTSAYTKSAILSEDTDALMVMPEGTIYWYGCEIVDIYNGNTSYITKNTNNISGERLQSKTTTDFPVRTNTTVDVTNYSKIRFHYAGLQNFTNSMGYVGATTTAYTSYTSSFGAKTSISTDITTKAEKWLDVDISSLSGKYYIGQSLELTATTSGSVSFTLTRFWLE